MIQARLNDAVIAPLQVIQQSWNKAWSIRRFHYWRSWSSEVYYYNSSFIRLSRRRGIDLKEQKRVQV